MITLISPYVIFQFLNTHFNKLANKGKYITMNYSPDLPPDLPFARSFSETRLKLPDARDKINQLIGCIQEEIAKYPNCFELTIYRIPRPDYYADRIAIKLNVPNHNDDCSIVFIDIENYNMETRCYISIGNNVDVQKDKSWYIINNGENLISIIIGIFIYDKHDTCYDNYSNETYRKNNIMFRCMLAYREINRASPNIIPINKVMDLLAEQH